jgi:hypothetical protein
MLFNCEEEVYNPYRHKKFELRLGSVVNKFSTTKSKTHYRDDQIKVSVKNKYQENKVEVGVYDIPC